MKVIKTIDKFATFLSYIMLVITVLSLVFIIGITVVDVFLRYVFDISVLGAYEMSQYVLFLSIFCSFAYCQVTYSHITVTIFTSKMPRVLANILEVLAGILSAVIFGFVGVALAQQAAYYFNTNFVSDLLEMPVHIFIWLGSAGMFTFAFVSLTQALCKAAETFSGAEIEPSKGN